MDRSNSFAHKKWALFASVMIKIGAKFLFCLSSVQSCSLLLHWQIYRQIPEKRLATNLMVWQFGEFLPIFWKHLAPIFLVWRNVRPLYLHIYANYIFICIFTISKLADGWKIHDIKWKCESFERRSMLLITSHQICWQNVKTDYLAIFAKCWKPVLFLV